MIGRIDEIVFDCTDPAAMAKFWSEIVGGEPHGRDDDWHYVDPPSAPRLAFQRVPEPKTTKNRLHIDVAVADIEVAIRDAEALGAKRIGDIHADAVGSFQVLADPEGNEWCVVKPKV